MLEAVPPKGQKVTQQGLDNAVSIMRSRVDKLGVAEPEIRKQGNNQIVIELPGVKNAAQAAQLIGKTAQLEFYDLQGDLTGPSVTTSGFARVPVATASLYNLLSGQQAKAKQGTPTAYYLFDKNKRLIAGPSDTRQGLFNARAPRVPKGGKVFAVPADTTVITCTATENNPCPPGDTAIGQTVYYLFKHDPTNPNEEKRIPEMTGAELKSSGTQADFDPQTGQPVVRLAFTGKGNRIFQRITKNLYQRGRLWQAPQMFAIVLDGDIKSWPQIDYTDPSLANGISGGGQITNIGKYGEAKDLAIVLQTGALPYVFNQLEQSQVSATLGKDSLNEAKLAAAIGLLVVALFLLLVYRFLGVVAVIGLGIYAAFLYGVILLLNVTLTLPGFAGIVLTIGVAADANIVVFERIKEEVRAGKSVRAAINAGYSKGFRTIVDANVVTAITALVLFAVATAGVKGFALMLLIGTVLSLVTAVAATRAMLGLLAGFRWFDNPAFMGASGQQKGRWLQIDFMGRRYLWFAISGVVIALGIGALAVRGLNLGIDFKGGTQVVFKTPEYTSLASVRNQAASIGQSDAVIQGKGSSQGDAYKSFQIRTKSLTPARQDTLSNDLQTKLKAESIGIQNVSSSFGRQIARLAILAIIVSLLLIIVYIAIRFDIKFAIPVIIALIHDLLITVGVYALTRKRGDDRHGRRCADRARVLDLRHDHHLRPHAREHPADARLGVRDDRQRLAVGDDPPLAGDDLHHAAAGAVAVLLRRRHPEDVCVGADRRHRLRCVFVDLHRCTAPDDVEGARAGVQAPDRQQGGQGRRRAARGGHGAVRGGTRRRTDPGDAAGHLRPDRGRARSGADADGRRRWSDLQVAGQA